MENQEHQDFDADAAFNEAAESLKSGELTASGQQSVAEETKQGAPDQREDNSSQDKSEQTQRESVQAQSDSDDLPEWLANATDEVKENFRKLQAENKRLDHMAKSQRGRVGALSKKYQQAQAALAQMQQQSPSGNLQEIVAKISNDYPDIADVLMQMMSTQEQRLQGISAPLNQIAEANIQEFAEQELNSAINYVAYAVPDAEQIVADPQFHAWLDRQPNGVRALFESNDPNDAIYLLSEYKKRASANQEQRAKRSQQLSAMSLPNGRIVSKSNDEFNEDALFNQLAEEHKRKQRY